MKFPCYSSAIPWLLIPIRPAKGLSSLKTRKIAQANAHASRQGEHRTNAAPGHGEQSDRAKKHPRHHLSCQRPLRNAVDGIDE
jgi:hypothetical protein